MELQQNINRLSYGEYSVFFVGFYIGLTQMGVMGVSIGALAG